MENDENGNGPHPTAIAFDQAPSRSTRQHQEEDEDQKDVPHSNVQTRSHRNQKIKRRRQRQKQDLAPAAQPASSDGIDDQGEEDQRVQRRLNDQRHWEIEPQPISIYLPKHVATPRIR